MDRTPEELAEVQRVHDVLSKAMDRERDRLKVTFLCRNEVDRFRGKRCCLP
jgi:hypothetical protein